MIHVDRKSVPEPEELKKRRTTTLSRLRKHYKSTWEYRTQRRYKFESHIWKRAKESLLKLFLSKCAYCESNFSTASHIDVEHFRPKAGARGLDGKEFHPDHYWWLAYDWENLLLACASCNQSKRDLFPVEDEARRARPEARLGELEKEPRLLLDPCGPENPEEELEYREDGELVGLTRRAQVTIDVLSLNRHELVEARARLLKQVDIFILSLSETADQALRSETGKLLIKMAASDAPFAGAARSAIRNAGLEIPLLEEEGVAIVSKPKKAEKKIKTTQLQSVWPETIHVRNFKAIHKLTLRFPPPPPKGAPWLTLVGPNAVGKSTILEAFALALATDGMRTDIVKDARKLLTVDKKGKKNTKATDGEVKVEFSDGSHIALQYTDSSNVFTVDGRVPRSLRVLGYGPHRIPPRRGNGRKKPQRIQIRNIFNPRWPLSDVNGWLCDPEMVSDEEFLLLVRNFRDLLPIVVRSDIRRRDGDLVTDLFGYETTLNELSSGYRSLISLAADIMMNLSTESVNVASTQGVVLLDEIETHLHPSWKIKIVASLRELFPAIRFVATTHDPLCLRGLENGEIYRMNRRRTTKRIFAESVDIPAGLTVDNLLTGSWFELEGTYDLETLDLLERHRVLLRSNSQDPAEIEMVEQQLRDRLGHFAETSLERQIMGVAADILKEESMSTRAPMKPGEFKQRLRERVRQERDA